MKTFNAVIIVSVIAAFYGGVQNSSAQSASEASTTAGALPAPGGDDSKAPSSAEPKMPEGAEEHGFHGQPEKMRKRLEQLFVWRVSDRLKLTPQEETKFTEQFKKLSDERTRLFQDMDAILDKIENAKDNTDKASKLLTDYNAVLKKQSQIQTKEMDVMSKIFGPKKMVQYVLLKREMTQRFKRVLSQNGGDAAAPKSTSAEKGGGSKEAPSSGASDQK